MRRLVSSIPIRGHDTIVWDGQASRQVNISYIWHSLRATTNPPAWVKVLWHPLAISKCSFTLWLALKDRLLTKERMARFGMLTDLSCVLCTNAIESNDHLFSSCIYTRTVLTDSSFRFTNIWTSYINGQFTLGRLTPMQTLLSYLYLATSVHYIWKERNDRMHNPGHACPASNLKQLIKRTMREKVCTIKCFQQAVKKTPNLILSLY